MRSTDGGRSFETFEIAATAGAADQPRALVKGGKLYAFWRQANEGFRLYPLP
jgi:hypothetical protein